tara:strand:- start:172 stop:414 length:243 start_codon:yes stop_codon:yes gene_type:complete
MNPAEIKIDLFRKLDGLKGKSLKEAYGVLVNFMNSDSHISDWENLSQEQKEAIQIGIAQLDNGEGKEHSQVMTSIRTKFL